MKQSTSARTKRYLEARGFTLAKTESYNFITKRKTDAYGFCDFDGVKGTKNYCFQACGGSGDVAKHVKKIFELPTYPIVSQAKEVYLLAWAKRNGGKHGKRKVWTVKIFQLVGDSCLPSEL